MMKKIPDYKGAIFDLDGVLVNTAKYHYLAWNTIAGIEAAHNAGIY
jgi:beta-phosphoglucomutase-like phosphatase (HAD superfamily)